MASFEKRGKKYRAIVSVMDRGARRKVSKTFDTKKEATNWAIIMEADKLQDKSIIASTMTFPDYFEKWMKLYKKNDVRESTYLGYKTSLKWIKTMFDNITLEKLSYPLLQQKIDFFGKSHSQGSTRKICIAIKASLKDAQFDEYIYKDIYSRLIPHGKAKKEKVNNLSAAEFEKMQRYLYENYKNHQNILALLVGIETGMRIGEILGLQYKDVSVPFKTININKSLAKESKKITAPKNKSSLRTIKISNNLITAIGSSKNANDFIFKTSFASVRRTLNQITDELNLTKITIHGLRHSHASYLLYKGVSINYVSKRLGHASTAITQNIYAHMLIEEKNNEQEKTLEALSMSPSVPKRNLDVDTSTV